MADEPTSEVEKLAHSRIISGGLDAAERAPEAAAEIATKIAAEAVQSAKSSDEKRMTVRRICRGVMSGMLLLNKNLPDTAICLLKASAVMSQDLNLDPMDVMTWCLEGIADITPVAPPEARGAIAGRIEENFMGAGQIFGDFCDQARAKKSWTQ